MAAWLNALRKRHAKQYQEMQTEMQELQYYKQRKEGYQESKQSDIQRQKQQAQAEAQRLADEEAAKVKSEALEVRRKELLENLPEEAPTDTKNVKKIALRFPDGGPPQVQRRFAPDQPVSDIFNWIDATYKMEREALVLTTLNGKLTLTWDEDQDKTLDEAGLGKMTGFRVTQQEESSDDESGQSKEES